jgi:hypothetical protein
MTTPVTLTTLGRRSAGIPALPQSVAQPRFVTDVDVEVWRGLLGTVGGALNKGRGERGVANELEPKSGDNVRDQEMVFVQLPVSICQGKVDGHLFAAITIDAFTLILFIYCCGICLL